MSNIHHKIKDEPFYFIFSKIITAKHSFFKHTDSVTGWLFKTWQRSTVIPGSPSLKCCASNKELLNNKLAVISEVISTVFLC
jgi:hypothetical protein